MCLHKIEKFKVHNYCGYKVFLEYEDTPLESLYFDLDKLFIGTWLQSTNTTIYSGNDERYQSGFHMYLTLRAAKRVTETFHSPKIIKIYRVRFKKVVATGFEGRERVVVAKEMLILNEVKRGA